MTRRVLLAEAAVVGLALTALSYGAALWAGWITGVDWLEVAAVATSYSCTYLCVVQSRMNYPVGVVTTVLYCVLLWRSGLYASAVTSGALSLWLVYGWFRWGPDRETLPVSSLVEDLAFELHVEPRLWSGTFLALVLYALLGVGFAGFAALVSSRFGGALPVADGAILGLTAVAQLMLDNKRIETWIVWVGVNCLTIWVYLKAEPALVLGALQYVLFLGNTVLGFWAWCTDLRSGRDIVARAKTDLAP